MASLGSWGYVLAARLGVAGARAGDDPLRLAHRVRHLGDAYYYAGRLAAADACYVEALGIYRSHERSAPLDLANAVRSFAVLKDEIGADEEAEPLWQEAHDRYLSLNASAGVAESAARLGLLARRHGDVQRTRECLREAAAAAEASADPETLEYVRKVTSSGL